MSSVIRDSLPNDPNGLRWAACSAAIAAMDSRDRVAVATFGENTEWLLQKGWWLMDKSRSRMQKQVEKARQAQGQKLTNLGAALEEAFDLLSEARNTPAIIILTDGDPTDRGKLQAVVNKQRKGVPIPVFLIFVNRKNTIDQEVRNLMKKLPGEIHELRKAEELPNMILSILSEIIPESIQITQADSFAGNNEDSVHALKADPCLQLQKIDFFLIGNSQGVLRIVEEPEGVQGRVYHTPFGRIVRYSAVSGRTLHGTWKFTSSESECFGMIRNPPNSVSLRFPVEPYPLSVGNSPLFLAAKVPLEGKPKVRIEFLERIGEVIESKKFSHELGWQTSGERIFAVRNLQIPEQAERANLVLGGGGPGLLEVRKPIRLRQDDFEHRSLRIGNPQIDPLSGMIHFPIKLAEDDAQLFYLDTAIISRDDPDRHAVIVSSDPEKPVEWKAEKSGVFDVLVMARAKSLDGQKEWQLFDQIRCELPANSLGLKSVSPDIETLTPGAEEFQGTLHFIRAHYLREWPKFEVGLIEAKLKPLCADAKEEKNWPVLFSEAHDGDVSFYSRAPLEAGEYLLSLKVKVTGATLVGESEVSIKIKKEAAVYQVEPTQIEMEFWDVPAWLPFLGHRGGAHFPMKVRSSNFAGPPEWFDKPQLLPVDGKSEAVDRLLVESIWGGDAKSFPLETGSLGVWQRSVSLKFHEPGEYKFRLKVAAKVPDVSLKLKVRSGLSFWVYFMMPIIGSVALVMFFSRFVQRKIGFQEVYEIEYREEYGEGEKYVFRVPAIPIAYSLFQSKNSLKLFPALMLEFWIPLLGNGAFFLLPILPPLKLACAFMFVCFSGMVLGTWLWNRYWSMTANEIAQLIRESSCKILISDFSSEEGYLGGEEFVGEEFVGEPYVTEWKNFNLIEK